MQYNILDIEKIMLDGLYLFVWNILSLVFNIRSSPLICLICLFDLF